MRKATKHDKARVVDILSGAYKGNPSVDHVVKRKRPSAYRKLFGYLFDEMQSFDAMYITDDEMGVAAIYECKNRKFKVAAVWARLMILLRVAGLKRGVAAMKRARTIKQKRHSEPCLYFWMLAVDPDKQGIDTMQEIRDFVFEMSEKPGLPIYAETPLKRTRIVYERYGFETYDEVVFDEGFSIWLMRRRA